MQKNKIKTAFKAIDYEIDLHQLFSVLDADASSILYALAESVGREELGGDDDLKVAAIIEAADKVKKIEDQEN